MGGDPPLEKRLEGAVDYVLGVEGVPTCVVKTREKEREASPST